MGSSNSIQKTSCDIYMSYDVKQENNANVISIANQLRQEGLQVYLSDDTQYQDDTVEYQIEKINRMMNNTRLFVICIYSNTFRSFQQNLEWNHALKDKYKMVFLMMEPEYTPKKNTFLQYMVNTHTWFDIDEPCLVTEILNLLDVSST